MSCSMRGAWLLAALVGAAGTAVSVSGTPADQQRRSRPPPARGAPPADQERAPLLRGEDALARVYDFILDARFDQVDAELSRACGPAPAEACDLLTATALWWRILLDPLSRSLDAEFSAAVETAIRVTEAWTERAPEDPEAWFYLGGAYAARVQWRVLREERVAAARDGKRIKQALERSIQLAPGLEDAYFGIGLYKYYADVAPTAAKVLRFFLMLPGGNRSEGLAQMQRARNAGRLLQGEADYQLHLIYLWYERQPLRALELLRALQNQYPGNPLFPAIRAEIQETYQHDVIASLDSWRGLLELARAQRVNMASLAEVRARLGAARQLEVLHQTDHAIELLDSVVTRRPQAPYSSLAQAYLRLGEAHDRLGSRAAATAAYRAAAAAAPPDDPYDVRDRRRRIVSPSRAGGGWRTPIFLPPPPHSSDRCRSIPRTPSRAIDSAACSRRGGTMQGRWRSSKWRSGRRTCARRPSSRRPTSKRRGFTSARAVRRRQSALIAGSRRSSAAPTRRATPLPARSPASRSPDRTRPPVVAGLDNDPRTLLRDCAIESGPF
jgi:tetratricopeptide (TPR) repeat protein